MSTIPAEGTYELSVDVSNPGAKRGKSPYSQDAISWTLDQLWPRGMVVQLSVSGKGVAYVCLPGGDAFIDEHDERFALLTAHLVPVVETPSLWLTRMQAPFAALDILDRLVASGRITLADVQRMNEERSGS